MRVGHFLTFEFRNSSFFRFVSSFAVTISFREFSLRLRRMVFCVTAEYLTDLCPMHAFILVQSRNFFRVAFFSLLCTRGEIRAGCSINGLLSITHKDNAAVSVAQLKTAKLRCRESDSRMNISAAATNAKK